MKSLVTVIGNIPVVCQFEVEADTQEKIKQIALGKASLTNPEDWAHYTNLPDLETLRVGDTKEINYETRDQEDLG